MKQYILTALIAAGTLTLGLTGCQDFLDAKPEGTPTTNNYFQNDGQAIQIVKGLYADVHQEDGFGGELFWEQGAANDIVWGRTQGYNTLATFEYTGDEEPLRNVWGRLVPTIARANWVVDGLLNKEKKTKLSDIERRSLGEAYFMRAFCHFYMAYRYGSDKQGFPFIKYEELEGEYDGTIPPQRESVMENYRLIIEDLEHAMEYLPRFETYGPEDRGRAHQAAALGLEAKVYAYWATWDKSKWDVVIQLVDRLESEYGRGLAPRFADNFASDFSKFWGPEYVWTFASTGGVRGGGIKFPGVVLENKAWGKYNGWGQNKPSFDIYEEMLKDGEGNDRLITSILEYDQPFMFFGEERRFYSESDIESGFMINKYMDAFKHKDAYEGNYVNPNGNFMTTKINFPIIRFAELMLFRAEANLVNGNGAEAAKDINALRTRARVTPISGPATWADLYHERRVELAFEFTDHLYDLKRWHLSGAPEIKALAERELNSHPNVRHYADRRNPKSPFTVGPYEDYMTAKPYQDYMITFPYPSDVITNSNGKLKQNIGYAK